MLKDTDDEGDYENENEDEEIRQIKKKYRVPMNTWIIKPGENTNRGVGISVASDMHEIRSLIGSASGDMDSTHII